jgi:hypothetical protein
MGYWGSGALGVVKNNSAPVNQYSSIPKLHNVALILP